MAGFAIVLPASGVAQSAAGKDANRAAATSPPPSPTASAVTPVRYPAYPVARRIEPIVPLRMTPIAAAARKALAKAATAAAPKAALSNKPAPQNPVRLAANPPLPGRQALGGPPPSAKVVPAVKRAKATSKAAAKR